MLLTATPTEEVRYLLIGWGFNGASIIEGCLDRPENFLETKVVAGLNKLDTETIHFILSFYLDKLSQFAVSNTFSGIPKIIAHQVLGKSE